MSSVPLLSYGYRYAPPFFLESQIRDILDDFQPNIIHCNSHFSPNTVLLRLAKDMNIPVMASNHFMPENLLPYLHLPSFLNTPLHSLFWKNWSHTYEQFSVVVSPTEAAANVLRTNTPVTSLAVISNGVDTSRFHPQTDKSILRQKFGITSNVPIVLCIGRLDREKHIDVILRAFAIFHAESKGHLLIAGRGSDQHRLAGIVQELHIADSVSFLGFVPDADLPDLYAASDCYVIASIAELQSISTLEAMATGLPIVAARALALPELVKDGSNGFTFDPDNASDCALCIGKVFASKDTYDSLSKESLLASKKHDIHESVKAFEQLYVSTAHRTSFSF